MLCGISCASVEAQPPDPSSIESPVAVPSVKPAGIPSVGPSLAPSVAPSAVAIFSSEVIGAPAGITAELSSSHVVAGTIVMVTLHLPAQVKFSSISGSFFGIHLTFFPRSEAQDGVYCSVLGVPYEHILGKSALSISIVEPFGKEGGSRDATTFQIPFEIVDGKYPSEKLHVDSRRVSPTNRKDLARIKRDLIEVAEIYKRETPQKYWNGPFVLPIQSAITSLFGTKRLYNGALHNFHPGLDLRAPIGTPVHPGGPGIVVLAKSLFYTGNTVMIDHGYGIVTLYAHMSRLKVKVGQAVTVHDQLGLSGKTGRVNGPHLHWQAVVHRTKINPLGLIQVLQ